MGSFWNEFASLRVQPTDGNATVNTFPGSTIPFNGNDPDLSQTSTAVESPPSRQSLREPGGEFGCIRRIAPENVRAVSLAVLECHCRHRTAGCRLQLARPVGCRHVFEGGTAEHRDIGPCAEKRDMGASVRARECDDRAYLLGVTRRG